MTKIEMFLESLAAIQTDIYANARAKGFWEHGNFGEKIALIHSELSEALEAFRKNPRNIDEHCSEFTNVEIELADAVIRILDLSEHLGLRLGKAIVAKHEFNKTREYKHGKNF